MDIYFDKLYRYDRDSEHCGIAIPVAKGELYSVDNVRVLDGDKVLPTQIKVTSKYEDGSIRFIYVKFMCDLPGNGKKKFTLDLHSKLPEVSESKLLVVNNPLDITVNTGKVEFKVSNKSGNLFDYLVYKDTRYEKEQFVGPILKSDGEEYGVEFSDWKIVEEGPLSVIISTLGRCIGKKSVTFECKISAYADKEWVDIAYRIINSTDEKLNVDALVFALKSDMSKKDIFAIEEIVDESTEDSTGCGDRPSDNSENFGPYFETNGIKELDMISERIDIAKVRTIVGKSNYKTTFKIANGGMPVCHIVDSKALVAEANEHFAEVLYGTFFTDRTDDKSGVCATIFQAQQNYPKAVKADGDGIYVMLVPENVDYVHMASGMSREQRFMLHFHDADTSIKELDNRSLIYQMPDSPYIMPNEFDKAGVMPNIFVGRDDIIEDVELSLIGKADGHARAYGMLNFGDTPDAGYTAQGRAKGRIVWSNNEYDYPHSMYLMYARSGVRRFLDYANVSAKHWMDVDICHYSSNPLNIGGQWEHTGGHCDNGIMVCSHEWVEGLIDCYHFTGDERALESALGIGENVLRLLETPMYQKSGESNARETGWALRTLTALYLETWDKKWITKCEWIVGHFKEWIEEFGEWVATYTDNTTIRVPFMISIAVGSLMRYYRLFPSEDLKKLMLSAVDDMVDNCYLPYGLFYYKELPSLSRNGNNTLILEALTIAYELSGDKRYLEYGKKTFEKSISAPTPGVVGAKKIVEDAVLAGSNGTKTFAQSFLPLTLYYKACVTEHIKFKL